MEYQQVYSSSFFGGPVSITGISFFIADYAGPNTGFSPATYEVELSTTSKAVGGLDSSDLRANLGGDNQVFFDGSLDGGSSIAGSAFNYDPANGNLLMTVIITGGAVDCDVNGSCGSQGLMWRSDANGLTSRAFYDPDMAYLGYAERDASDVGLITSFTYQPASARVPTPVPEPSMMSLFAIVVIPLLRVSASRSFLRRRSLLHLGCVLLLATEVGFAQTGTIVLFRENRSVLKTAYSNDPANSHHIVFVDGNRVATIKKGQFVALQLKPGPHDVKAARSEHVSVTLKEGDTLFFRPRFNHTWALKLRVPEEIEQIDCTTALSIFNGPNPPRPIEPKKVTWVAQGLSTKAPVSCEK